MSTGEQLQMGARPPKSCFTCNHVWATSFIATDGTKRWWPTCLKRTNLRMVNPHPGGSAERCFLFLPGLDFEPTMKRLERS